MSFNSPLHFSIAGYLIYFIYGIHKSTEKRLLEEEEEN